MRKQVKVGKTNYRRVKKRRERSLLLPAIVFIVIILVGVASVIYMRYGPRSRTTADTPQHIMQNGAITKAKTTQ